MKPLNTTDFHTNTDEVHHAQLTNLAAMAQSIMHQVGTTEVADPALTTLVNFNGPTVPFRCRADRRRPRRPVRHNKQGGANERRHGVRDRQDRPRLRQHPHHPGQL